MQRSTPHKKYLWIWIALSIIFITDRYVRCDPEVNFYYFSREHPTEKLQITNENLDNLIKVSSPIKIIIHGWGESSERPYYKRMTQEYLIKETVQVIQVDWKYFAAKPYLQAAENVKEVGSDIAKLLLKLSENSITDVFKKIHVVGHSLGAHVAGHVGKTIFQESGKLLDRITGLDPAGPHFNIASTERLESSDATFVDITHTDGNYFGLDRAIGHVDFYPNGGHRPQPGCELFNPALLHMDPSLIAFCSHTQSYQYFIESINNQTIMAYRCANYEQFKSGSCRFNTQIVYGETTPSNNSGNTGKVTVNEQTKMMSNVITLMQQHDFETLNQDQHKNNFPTRGGTPTYSYMHLTEKTKILHIRAHFNKRNLTEERLIKLTLQCVPGIS